MSSSSRRPRQPSYRLHKPTGLAVVTLSGRDVYLGKHASSESKRAYQRLMLEWLANDGYSAPRSSELTVVELANAYKQWAKRYYVRDGKPTVTYEKVSMIMKYLGNGPYGRIRAAEFGPLALKALQTELAGSDKARSFVNDLIAIVRRCFKWGVSEELVPPSVFHAIQTVPGLRRGRSNARETAPVLPVHDAVVEATLPFLPPIV